MNREQTEELAAFKERLEGLGGDDLLDEQIAFDQLAPPQNGERDFRFLKGQMLEAALTAQFGIGQWQQPLEARRKASSVRAATAGLATKASPPSTPTPSPAAMETATEAALQAIIKALIQTSQNDDLSHAITQNLYGAVEELGPSVSGMVGRLADYARDCKGLM
jgi:hypothetical protein